MEIAMTYTAVGLKNILVATDFSSTSEKALKYATAIAARYNSKIHLMHVIRPTAAEFLPPDTASQAYEQLHQAAEESLKKESEKLPGVCHEIHLVDGTVSESVGDLVREHHIDLVVVGTHAATGFEKLVLGSTAEEVFRSATCPVLTVGPNAPAIDAVIGLSCILFPTDLESDESVALSHALSLASRYGARLILLHVMVGVQPPPGDKQERCESSYLNRLERLIPADVELPHPAEFRIEYRDHAPDVILRVAGEVAADLIVLGVRPKEAWATRLPDNAYRVVAGSLCPVLTVRESESA